MLNSPLTGFRKLVKAIRDLFAVSGYSPAFVADFDGGYYRTTSGLSTFSQAITHSRSGNATMTDGYGPELVTNGTFDSDISGWAHPQPSRGSISFDMGSIRVSNDGTGGNLVEQAIPTVAGKAYLMIGTGTQGGATRGRISAATTSFASDLGSSFLDTAQSFVFRASGATTYIALFASGGSGSAANFATFDNISVREMPAIKWGPHNLLPYSEDFTQWGYLSAVAATPNSVAAPDGTLTADTLQEESSGTGGARYYNDYRTVTADQKTTFSAFMKKGTSDYGYLSARHSNNNIAGAEFDLDAGTVDSTNNVGNCTLNGSSTVSYTHLRAHET